LLLKMTSSITGDMLIGATAVRGAAGQQRAFNPSADADISEPVFGMGGLPEVDRAAALAAAAFDTFRRTPPAVRAGLLEAIADNILQLGEALIERAHAETGLPVARLQGERGRTVGQLRLFAQVVRDGHHLQATIDTALPQRLPMPRSDVRMCKMPLGPVAVFGASNFPLAFSVAGGDTASALAVGSPVIVKAHSAHLGTSEWVGRTVQAAVQKMGLPEGVFSLLFGTGRQIGEALVAHPEIKAVGFTGSRQGGLALAQIAQARPEPIPVYAEMSSINPVFLLPGALAQRAEAVARAFVESLTLGAGQFCTNPGLVIAVDGPGLTTFINTAVLALRGKPAQTMLTSAMHGAYCADVDNVEAVSGVTTLGQGLPAHDLPNAAQAKLYSTDAQHFLSHRELGAEIFGPAAIVVRCRDLSEALEIAERLEGQLTATIHLDPADHGAAQRLLPVLERKAGRLLVNGFPTGVEVCHAMVHGGPFPATTNAMFTSVGATAIDRFLRPVCYQDVPDSLLPEPLQERNPWALRRRVNGAFI